MGFAGSVAVADNRSFASCPVVAVAVIVVVAVVVAVVEAAVVRATGVGVAAPVAVGVGVALLPLAGAGEGPVGVGVDVGVAVEAGVTALVAVAAVARAGAEGPFGIRPASARAGLAIPVVVVAIGFCAATAAAVAGFLARVPPRWSSLLRRSSSTRTRAGTSFARYDFGSASRVTDPAAAVETPRPSCRNTWLTIFLLRRAPFAHRRTDANVVLQIVQALFDAGLGSVLKHHRRPRSLPTYSPRSVTQSSLFASGEPNTVDPQQHHAHPKRKMQLVPAKGAPGWTAPLITGMCSMREMGLMWIRAHRSAPFSRTRAYTSDTNNG